MVLPILIVAGIAAIVIPILMTREIIGNELLIMVVGVVALAYVLKVAK